MRVCFECQSCYDDSEDYCVEEGHPVLSQIRDGSPDIAPGYRLDLLLDTGIKGETYLAHQTESGGTCLIRIVSADVETSRQFLSNAELAAAFFHPSVVDVYEAGHLSTGEVFVVSENADGDTLREVLENERVPNLLTTIQVTRQAAEALYALHSHGLTHGAINPDNIILATDAQNRLLVRVKDIDFGGVIGRSVTANKFLIDSALDMLKYFAPEQCSGNGPSTQADIYSLGIVLHEMLAGAPPFNASKAVGLIEQHRNQPPPEIKIDNFDLRMLLTHTLTEALRKQPELRQHSANDFARQMRHIEQLKTHATIPPPAGTTRPAPPRSAAVFTSSTEPSRFVVTPPVAAVEEREEAHEDNILLAADMVEPEPISAADVECEPVPEIIPASPVKALPIIDDLLFEEPVVEAPTVEAEPKAPRRSRLRAMTEKLRSIAPALPKKRAKRSDLAVGSAYEKLAEVRSTLTGIPSIEAELAKAAVDRARKAPTKIEWQTPEDDIPSEAAVLEALSIEPAPIKIKWEQIEDDIPLEADVVEVLALEPIAEIPIIQAEPAKAAVVVSSKVPARIEWDQPEDDLPSEAAVLEAVSKEPVIDIPVVHAEPAKAAEIPASREAAVIEPDPVFAFEVESVRVPEVVTETSGILLPEIQDVSVIEPVVQIAVVEAAAIEPKAQRPLRMKALTEKLRSLASGLPKMGRSEPLHIIGPSYQPRSTPAEIPAVRLEPALEAAIEPTTRRPSQLKTLTEKLRSMAPALPKMGRTEPLHIIGHPYQPQPTPVEIPAVQPAPAAEATIVPGASRLSQLKALTGKLRSMAPALPKIRASEALHIVGSSYQPPAGIPAVQPVPVVQAAIEPRSSRLSQLKALTGKLRSLAPALPKIRASEALHIVESSYEPRTTLVEIPAVQPESLKAAVEVAIFEQAVIEPESVQAPTVATEPVPAIVPEVFAHLLPVDSAPLVEEPVIQNRMVEEKIAAKAPRRPRKKALKKELQATPPAPEITAIHEKVEPIAERRSRIKTLKRKLRSLAPPAQEIQVSEEEVVSRAPRRSRLKLLKKKLRSMIPPPQLTRVEESIEPTAPRRSRLKMLKRKLRSMVPHIPLLPVSEALPIVEPAVEKLVEVRAESTETKFVEAEPSKTKGISTIIMPTMIDWAESEERIPEKAVVPVVLSAEPALPEIPSVQAKPVEILTAQDESKPVRIETEPKPATAPPVFLPGKYMRPRRPRRVKPLPPVETVAATGTLVKTDRRDPLFSSYYNSSSGRRRSAMVIGGLVVLFALGFVGRLVFSDGAPAEVQRAAADLPAAQRSLPRAGKPHVDAPMVKTVKLPESARQEEAVGASIMMPPAKAAPPIKAVADRNDDDDLVVRPQKARSTLVSRNYGQMGAPLMSTLVISYGNGKVTSSVEPYRQNSVDSKRVSIPSKIAEPGRPRVVKHSNDDK